MNGKQTKKLIWETNTPPPTNYIWVKPNGKAYEFNNNTHKWEVTGLFGINSQSDSQSTNDTNALKLYTEMPKDVSVLKEGDVVIDKNRYTTINIVGYDEFISGKINYNLHNNTKIRIYTPSGYQNYGESTVLVKDGDNILYTFDGIGTDSPDYTINNWKFTVLNHKTEEQSLLEAPDDFLIDSSEFTTGVLTLESTASWALYFQELLSQTYDYCEGQLVKRNNSASQVFSEQEASVSNLNPGDICYKSTRITGESDFIVNTTSNLVDIFELSDYSEYARIFYNVASPESDMKIYRWDANSSDWVLWLVCGKWYAGVEKYGYTCEGNEGSYKILTVDVENLYEYSNKIEYYALGGKIKIERENVYDYYVQICNPYKTVDLPFEVHNTVYNGTVSKSFYKMEPQSDWNSNDSNSTAYIKNKPTVPRILTLTQIPTSQMTWTELNNCGLISDVISKLTNGYYYGIKVDNTFYTIIEATNGYDSMMETNHFYLAFGKNHEVEKWG